MTDDFPPFLWAKDIRVESLGTELAISGTVPVIDEDFVGPDPLRAYRNAISRFAGAKRQGKNATHVQFGNADTLEKQIAFISRYGPIVLSSAQLEEHVVKAQTPLDFDRADTVIVARQSLAELERERRVYRAILELISELRPGHRTSKSLLLGNLSIIVEYVSFWPAQWDRERELRERGIGYSSKPRWNFQFEDYQTIRTCYWEAEREPSGDPIRDALFRVDPCHEAHQAISHLLNAFPPQVYPWGNRPIEAPSWDIAPGIRPLLYYMLRREYLSSGGIAICRNSSCRAIFEIERSGQEFCGADCSRLQRQREYWETRGKTLRKGRKRRRNGSNRIAGRHTRKGE